MSNLVDYAEEELNRAGWDDPDAMYGTMIKGAVLDLVRIFADQGHSGMSAAIVTTLVEKVMRFEPLTPLTGEDDEWLVLDCDENMVAQNRRYASVFKRADGTAYDIDGRVFRTPSGMTYGSRDSHVEVTFPYTPSTEVVDVPERVDE